MRQDIGPLMPASIPQMEIGSELLHKTVSMPSTSVSMSLDLSGFWAGTLFLNGAAYTNFSMSLVQIVGDEDEDAFAASTLQGTFNANSKCIGGGVITGTLNANNVIIDVSTSTGLLSLAGSASSSNAMTGSWSHTGVSASEEEGNAGRGTCDLSGTWTAGR